MCVLFSPTAMTAKEFVNIIMKKDSTMGVQGYQLAKTMTAFDGPLVAKIHAGKKKTFIDDEVKAKSHVPDARYNVTLDWTANKRSNMCKGFRHTLATEIEHEAKKHSRPEPQTYKPEHKLVEPRLKGAFNLKGNRDDTGFLADSFYKGQTSPRFHDKKHHLVEKRVTTNKFYKPINEKLDAQPSFLRAKKATHMISPASHNPLDSLKLAVMPKKTFYMRKGSPKSHVDIEIQRTKKNPGVGHYNIKNIEKAFDKITLGAAKGWK
jgi:hypothetical protein